MADKRLSSTILKLILISFTIVFVSGVTNAITVPPNIAVYWNVTITNTQNSPTANGLSVMIPINFNTNNINEYLHSNLTNEEWFYANGTVATSWFEGNTLNELQTTNLTTTSNGLYWLKLNPSLPAKTGNIVVYFGEAYSGILGFPSVIYTNNVDDGIAPQLYGTSNSPQISYGLLDDGAKVFSNYANFKGNAIPAGWTANANGNSIVSINNGLTISSYTINELTCNCAFSVAYLVSNWIVPNNEITEVLLKNESTYNNQDMILVSSGSSNSFAWNAFEVGYQNQYCGSPVISGCVTGYNGLTIQSNDGSTPIFTANSVPPVLPPAVIGVYSNTLYSGYSKVASISGNILANGYLSSKIDSGYAGNFSIYYFRQRANPPNGIMPSTSFGNINYIANSAITLSKNSITLFAGENAVLNFSATVSYNVIITQIPSNAFQVEIYDWGLLNSLDINSSLNKSYRSQTTPLLNSPSSGPLYLSVGSLTPYNRSYNITLGAVGYGNKVNLVNLTLTVVPPSHANLTLSIQNSITTYGAGDAISASASDNSVINILINGDVVASGTTSVSYSNCLVPSSNCLAAGTYNVVASSPNANYTLSKTLVVAQAVPQLTLSVPANFTYDGAGANVIFGISSINNQLNATLSGSSIAATTNSVSRIMLGQSPGIYDLSLFTNGNSNYTQAILNGSFSVTYPYNVIDIGRMPDAIAFDSCDGFVYVANFGANTVSVIQNTTIIRNISVGIGPKALQFDRSNCEMYVADNESNDVRAIVNLNVISTTDVASDPVEMAFDNASNQIYVADFGSNLVSLINTTDNNILDGNIAVGSEPIAILYNPIKNYTYVANFGSADVSVLNGDSVVATVGVGQEPDALAYNQSGCVYVADYGSADVYVICSNTVIKQISAPCIDNNCKNGPGGGPGFEPYFCVDGSCYFPICGTVDCGWNWPIGGNGGSGTGGAGGTISLGMFEPSIITQVGVCDCYGKKLLVITEQASNYFELLYNNSLIENETLQAITQLEQQGINVGSLGNSINGASFVTTVVPTVSLYPVSLFNNNMSVTFAYQLFPQLVNGIGALTNAAGSLSAGSYNGYLFDYASDDYAGDIEAAANGTEFVDSILLEMGVLQYGSEICDYVAGDLCAFLFGSMPDTDQGLLGQGYLVYNDTSGSITNLNWNPDAVVNPAEKLVTIIDMNQTSTIPNSINLSLDSKALYINPIVGVSYHYLSPYISYATSLSPIPVSDFVGTGGVVSPVSTPATFNGVSTIPNGTSNSLGDTITIQVPVPANSISVTFGGGPSYTVSGNVFSGPVPTLATSATVEITGSNNTTSVENYAINLLKFCEHIGGSIILSLPFGWPTFHTVTFMTNLASNSVGSWGVTAGGSSHSTTLNKLNVTLPSAIWPYSVNPPVGYACNPNAGNLNLTTSNQIVSLTCSMIANKVSNTYPIPVGKNPIALLFDDNTCLLYVANYGSNTVSVIQGIQNIGNLSVGKEPVALTLAGKTGWIYVANNGDGTLSVINITKVFATLGVGQYPVAMAYDPLNNYIYVSRQTTNSSEFSIVDNLTVLTGGSTAFVPQSNSTSIQVANPCNGGTYELVNNTLIEYIQSNAIQPKTFTTANTTEIFTSHGSNTIALPSGYNSIFFATGSYDVYQGSSVGSVTYNSFTAEQAEHTTGCVTITNPGGPKTQGKEYCYYNASAVGNSVSANFITTLGSPSNGGTIAQVGLASVFPYANVVAYDTNGLEGGAGSHNMFLSFPVNAVNDTAYILGSTGLNPSDHPTLPHGCTLDAFALSSGSAWAANCTFSSTGVMSANVAWTGPVPSSISVWVFKS